MAAIMAAVTVAQQIMIVLGEAVQRILQLQTDSWLLFQTTKILF